MCVGRGCTSASARLRVTRVTVHGDAWHSGRAHARGCRRLIARLPADRQIVSLSNLVYLRDAHAEILKVAATSDPKWIEYKHGDLQFGNLLAGRDEEGVPSTRMSSRYVPIRRPRVDHSPSPAPDGRCLV